MRLAILAILFTAACVTDDEPLPDADVLDVDAALAPDADVDAATDARAVDAPPSTLIEVAVTIGPDGDHDYARVSFYVNCPDGAPDGPHAGAIELYSNLGLIDIASFTWTCGFSSTSTTWFDLSCGLDVWARGVIGDTLTGAPAYQVSETKPTRACAP